jgi:carbon-monoxide dehydrogenase medium subunit
MPIPYDINYAKPNTLDEAIDLLARNKGKARLLAGGTDLINELKLGFRVPEIIIDLKGIKALNEISLNDGKLFIGAGVNFSEIIVSDLIQKNAPVLQYAARYVASNGVRNRATMIGNIASAVACMDSAGPLLVHRAEIHVQSVNNKRIIPIEKWFIDNRKTSLEPDEIVTGASLEIPKQKYGSAYQKQMRYHGEDLSQSNVCIMALEDNTFRVAFGSVGPIPKRSRKIESILNGKAIDKALINTVKESIEKVISPIDDLRSSKEYRIQMVKVMFERGLNEAMHRLKQPKLIS